MVWSMTPNAAKRHHLVRLLGQGKGEVNEAQILVRIEALRLQFFWVYLQAPTE
jgi:hypothetical protein